MRTTALTAPDNLSEIRLKKRVAGKNIPYTIQGVKDTELKIQELEKRIAKLEERLSPPQKGTSKRPDQNLAEAMRDAIVRACDTNKSREFTTSEVRKILSETHPGLLESRNPNAFGYTMRELRKQNFVKFLGITSPEHGAHYMKI